MTISMLKWITEKVRPPRSLAVPFPLGFPLGKPDDPELQRKVLMAALDMIADPSASAGEIRNFPPE
ncbi:MAG: hypothetical protein R3338_09845 [Thermoanaerobaculia bacterium]|nr:hypothetical protein [Thermoanaerobaculia bacterium]